MPRGLLSTGVHQIHSPPCPSCASGPSPADRIVGTTVSHLFPVQCSKTLPLAYGSGPLLNVVMATHAPLDPSVTTEMPSMCLPGDRLRSGKRVVCHRPVQWLSAQRRGN